VKASIPLVQMSTDDNQPMLRLIVDCLFWAGILLIPAGIDVARRGCRAVLRLLAPSGGRRRVQSECGQPAIWDSPHRAHRCLLGGEYLDACACQWPFCRRVGGDQDGWPIAEEFRLAGEHRVRESCTLANERLGDLTDSSALAAFRERLATEGDLHVVVEIAHAVARIGGDEAAAILAGLKSHRSAVVRQVASRLGGEISGEGGRQVPPREMNSSGDHLGC
jgi:hypothetical protein